MTTNRKQFLYYSLVGTGLLSLSALIYFVGPMIAIGNWRPFEDERARWAVCAAILFVGGAIAFWIEWRRASQADAIEAGIAGGEKAVESDERVLSGRMKDALATLKAAGGDKADYLYDLPWYIIIGPPGSGKTTALVNSGLKFPLSRGATPAAIAGSGGTRYCDWWFTEDAVLIDTAGRYTTQDSDADADAKSWRSFLDLLKGNRPHQPINGAIVAISLEDMLSAKPEELNAHADAIRARLLELHERLKVDFPVYALFTKADLIAGFTEFFGNLDERGRAQVWGATFQTSDKTRNMVGDIPAEFDELLLRLNDLTTDRLQEEPTPSTRVALFGLPAQMANLRKPVHDFLNRIFEPTRYHANAALRGFYFTSGTQQGTPIDQLLGSFARNFGAQEVKAAHYSGLGKSFFLTNLIGQTIIGEANWVSTDVASVRRGRLLEFGLYGLMALVAAGLVGAWSVSFARNRQLIADVDASAANFVAEAGGFAKETRISDRDMKRALPLLDKLRYLPAGYEERGKGSLAEDFGLSQRERLETTDVNAYRLGLERFFRPRLYYRLEEVLERNRDNPNELYDALKVYLMLGGVHKADNALIESWMRNDWAVNLYPGAGYAPGREALEQHLEAMLALNDGHEPPVGLNESLVAEAQRNLARLSVSQRAYALLKSESHSVKAPDWQPSKVCGDDFTDIFEAGAGERATSLLVPGFYTYAGFHRAFLDRLSGVRERLQNERWVLAPPANRRR